jgi:hypothetical protein
MDYQPAAKKSRGVSLRRLSAYAGISLGVGVLGVAVILFVFGGTILNGYGKAKAEGAFAAAHPGCALRIGELGYAVGANCLVAQRITLSATNTTLKIERISLTGVRWRRLLWGTVAWADVLSKASIEGTNLEVEFPQAHYGIRCLRMRASVPDSELIADVTELRPLVSDEEFFAAHDFRTTRLHVVVPECKVLGLAFGELLQGKAYRAQSVHFSRPSFDALVNRDKPPKPFTRSPLMVHELLASIPQPLQVDSLSLTNGHITYCERLAMGADPAVLTFGAVNMSIEGIANRSNAAAAIQIQGQGDFMNAGTLKLRMSIPISPPNFSLHYSGSLSAMDLTRLAPFLEIAGHTRIKSGRAQAVGFEIEVTAGHARGHVRAIYHGLVVAVLDKQNGTATGWDNRVASLLLNVLKIRNSSAPEASNSMKEGKVSYTRRPEDTFLQFAWFALRTGVMDVISF